MDATNTHREKLARALTRRPDPADFRQYLFWLVDVIYACKASKDPVLLRQARLLEDALGYFGAFLESGAPDHFSRLQQNLDAFARFVSDTSAPSPQADATDSAAG